VVLRLVPADSLAPLIRPLKTELRSRIADLHCQTGREDGDSAHELHLRPAADGTRVLMTLFDPEDTMLLSESVLLDDVWRAVARRVAVLVEGQLREDAGGSVQPEPPAEARLPAPAPQLSLPVSLGLTAGAGFYPNSDTATLWTQVDVAINVLPWLMAFVRAGGEPVGRGDTRVQVRELAASAGLGLSWIWGRLGLGIGSGAGACASMAAASGQNEVRWSVAWESFGFLTVHIVESLSWRLEGVVLGTSPAYSYGFGTDVVVARENWRISAMSGFLWRFEK
jgi:hypothetical protein